MEKYYPGSWDTNYAKSFHALRSGDYPTAIKAGQNALMSPDRKGRAAKFGRTYLNIGAAQVMQKDWAKAAASLQEAAQRVPEIPAVYAFLGTAQAGAGQTQKALRTLANALPPRGQEVAAFTTLAWIHSVARIRLGRFWIELRVTLRFAPKERLAPLARPEHLCVKRLKGD